MRTFTSCKLPERFFFLHEHPDLVGSWKEEVIDELLQDPRVRRVQGDMCRHGMRGQGELAEAAVKKRTGFMTNSKQIGKASSLFCENRPGELKAWKRIDFGVQHKQSVMKGGPEWKQIARRVTMDAQTREVLQDLKDFQSATRSDIWQRFEERRDVITLFYYRERGSKWRRHVQLVGGKAKKAEVYPEGLLHNISKGLKREASLKNPLNTLEMGPVNEEPYLEEEELAGEDWSSFVDEVSGTALETTKVMAARAGELDYAHRYNVWTLAPLKGCWDNTGKPTIGCRWVDIDKGDPISPNYRSRLAVQEVRTSGTEAIFAATPPLESIRFLLSLQRSRKG